MLKDIFQSVTIAQVTGMESELSEAQVEQVAEAAAEEVVEAILDKELAEHGECIAENSAETDKLNIAVEAMQDKIEDLEEIVDGLESMRNGTTPFNAGLFAREFQRGQAIMAKFGRVENVDVMGAESFADASTAQLNAHAGLCAMTDTLKAAGAKVKEIFIQVFNSVIDTAKALLDRNVKLASSANNTKALIGKGKVKTGEITVPANAGKLLNAKGESGNAISDIVKALGAISTLDGEKVSKAVDGIKSGTATLSPTSVSYSGTPVSTITALSKDALDGLMEGVAKDAKRLGEANLSVKGLTNARDKAVAKWATALTVEQTKVAREAANEIRAGLTAARNAMKFGGDILAAKIAFARAHLSGQKAEA